jgi:hypothetical protein
MEHIRTCDPRPRVAFKEARKFAHEIDPNWKYSRVTSVFPPFTLEEANADNSTPGQMYSALINKFDQHDDLRRELIDTGDAELIQVRFIHYDFMRSLCLIGGKRWPRIETISGGVDQMGRARTNLENASCGFVSCSGNRNASDQRANGYGSCSWMLDLSSDTVTLLMYYVCIHFLVLWVDRLGQLSISWISRCEEE